MEKTTINDLIVGTFKENHDVRGGHNPNSLFLVGFDEEHVGRLREAVKASLDGQARPYKIVNGKRLTFRQLEDEITAGSDFSTAEEVLYQSDMVVVIDRISAMEDSAKGLAARALIKILDDAHLKDVHPMGDIIFIDHASFLEREWKAIGEYLKLNVSFV